MERYPIAPRHGLAVLELLYRVTAAVVSWCDPIIRRIGYARVDRWFRPLERWSKRRTFGCEMCGQCVLHSAGMVCPMTCPKQLRNGACGGVRADGGCEVAPEMKCVWVAAYERARYLTEFGPEIIEINPPVNHRLSASSAWVNMLRGVDKQTPQGWAESPHVVLVEREL